jgi:hypothetical protein
VGGEALVCWVGFLFNESVSSICQAETGGSFRSGHLRPETPQITYANTLHQPSPWACRTKQFQNGFLQTVFRSLMSTAFTECRSTKPKVCNFKTRKRGRITIEAGPLTRALPCSLPQSLCVWDCRLPANR